MIFLVLDIPTESDNLLAKKFEENATVFGLLDKPEELLITSPVNWLPLTRFF